MKLLSVLPPPQHIPLVAGGCSELPHPMGSTMLSVWHQAKGQKLPLQKRLFCLQFLALTCTGHYQGPTQSVPTVRAFCKICKKYSNCSGLRLLPSCTLSLSLYVSHIA